MRALGCGAGCAGGGAAVGGGLVGPGVGAGALATADLSEGGVDRDDGEGVALPDGTWM